MALTEQIINKILLIEKEINFPISLVGNKNYKLENSTMTSYSNLTGAISSIIENGRKILIITGFYIPGGTPPAIETDGPPGALILAKGLKNLGIEALLLSDHFTLPPLRIGLDILKIPEDEIPLICFPLDEHEKDFKISTQFTINFLKSNLGKDLTHLIYIERVGPNHTLESFLSQDRNTYPPVEEFNKTLPHSLRDRCFNSRLEDITSYTGKTHLLIEIKNKLGISIHSIGIGDRGNEIGAGRIPWEVFKRNSSSNREAIFCCRVKTDFLISCGISNWGAYALLAGVALAAGKEEILKKITPEQEGMILEHLIYHGPAIDGISQRQQFSVDGVEFKDYIRVVERVIDIALS